jgi:radical SAM superfamily enzyme YgiQ (UPF0313 family)
MAQSASDAKGSKAVSDAARVLLVSPPSRAFNHYRPPLALMYLSGYLKHNGIDARVIDICLHEQIRTKTFEQNRERFRRQVEDETVARIRTEETDIIGITCYTPELEESIQLAKRIKEIKPHARLIVGGIHPTLYPEHFLEPDAIFDFAVVGEGELTLLELVRAIRAGNADFTKVAGIAYRDSATGNPVITPVRPVLENLDDVVFPDYDDLDMEYYTTASPYSVRGVFVRSFYTAASRGCPSSCTFYVAKQLRDHQGPRHFTRIRSAKSLAAEVLHLRERYAIDGFYFIDDLFTLKKPVVLEFCELLQQSKVRLLWGCSSKVNTVNFEMLKAMRDAGCVQIDFGVEKGSDAALRSIQKGVTVAQVRNAFDLCHQLGIRTFANMLVNTPGEVEQDLEDILSLLRELRSEIVSINTFTPYPGCEIYDGMYQPVTRAEYDLLMKPPYELIKQLPERFRFAKHQVDFESWTATWMHKTNHTAANAAFFFDPRYLAAILASRRKANYLAQLISLAREFINQKF